MFRIGHNCCGQLEGKSHLPSSYIMDTGQVTLFEHSTYWVPWYLVDAGDPSRRFGAAARRALQDGPNQLTQEPRLGLVMLFLLQLTSPLEHRAESVMGSPRRREEHAVGHFGCPKAVLNSCARWNTSYMTWIITQEFLFSHLSMHNRCLQSLECFGGCCIHKCNLSKI